MGNDGRSGQLLGIALEEIRQGRGGSEAPVEFPEGVALRRVGRNEVWRIDLGTGKTYYAKRWSERAAFAREVYGYRLAQRVSQLDSRFMATDLVEVDPESGIFVTSAMPGKHVSDLLREGLRIDRNPLKRRETLANLRRAVDLVSKWLQAFHELDGVSQEFLYDHSPVGSMARINRKLGQEIRGTKIRDLVGIVGQLASPPPVTDSGLIFGDASPGNFLFANGKLGAVDFEDVGIGPIQRDFSVLRDSIQRAMNRLHYFSDRSLLRPFLGPSDPMIEEIVQLEMRLLRFEQLHQRTGLVALLERNREKLAIQSLLRPLQANQEPD